MDAFFLSFVFSMCIYCTFNSMKNLYKNVALLLLIIMTSCTAAAQREKVKGSRNVKEMSEPLRAFTDIKVTDGLEVTLIADAQTGFDLEMDDNLLELISFDIRDSLLLVSTRKEIRSSKRLNITVRFTELHSVSLDAKSKVTTKSTLESNVFKGNFLDGSEFEGEIRAETAIITANSNSKFEIDYNGDDLTINMNDNAFAKADINTDTFTLTAMGRTDLDFKGNAKDAKLNLSDNAEFKGRAFDVDEVIVVGRNSSSAIISVDKDIIVDLADKGEIQLYGEPKITMERFADSASLLKKG